MRVSREKFAENRQKILEVAGVLFRENGFDGIGVADIMKAAGLTHGGFYGHFGSKDDLAFEVSRGLIVRVEERWKAIIASAPERPLAALLDHYLSQRNVLEHGDSCIFASMMQEVSRQTGPVRDTFSQGLVRLVDLLEGIVPGQSAEERRANAFSTLSAIMGAVILARVVEDPEDAEMFLKGTRRQLLPDSA
ncbi:TetR/AcrR family transcriptional regulator [Rhizobium sp. BK251]|uniref:TetR/AcrR family transcriptional regulator n=1 Tax=Rhizobium sp. BK251 TaxID=2512125 RepID=UPI00104F4322|nr:TetR/AcrR family transcriptional regulator [Rhizobium sp. BK251]TCL72632.1 TetR family transcriptional regulator [Rhizobium sp. BK251]